MMRASSAFPGWATAGNLPVDSQAVGWRYRELAVGVVLLAAFGAAVFLGSSGGFRPLGGSRAEAPLVAAAHSDCERPRAGTLAQPANALSALAFAAAGLGVLAAVGRSRDHVNRPAMASPLGALYGGALLVVGAGSFAFHRSPTTWSGDLDAWGVTLVAIWWVVWNQHRKLRLGAPLASFVVLAATTGVVVVAAPGATTELQVIWLALAAWTEVSRPRLSRDWRRLAAAVPVVAAAVPLWMLSRDGGPWCDPDSLVQGHAGWHGLMAVALALGAWYLWSELDDPPGVRTAPAP